MSRKEEAAKKMTELLSKIIEEVPERLEAAPEAGIYQRAELQTPEGATFLVGPVHLWGRHARWPIKSQPVDLCIDRVPRHLHTSGLGDCSLTIFGSDGISLHSGPLCDDGNYQEGLNRICVAIVQHGTPALLPWYQPYHRYVLTRESCYPGTSATTVKERAERRASRTR